MNDPVASVVIPCYDVARWLPRCLDDVLAALPADAEAIAVDDGSTDETPRILRERAKVDARLHVIAVSHGGVSAARNRGLDVARGKYVFFVDPDDGVAPDFFTAMIDALERDGADCCNCAYSEHEDGSDDDRVVHLKGDYRFKTNEEIVSGYLPRIFGYSVADIRAWYSGVPLFANREMASSCRMGFRRSVLDRLHLRFDENLVLFEDAMFNAEYLLAAGSMTCIDRPLYRITCRSSGAMRSVPRDGLAYCRNKLGLLKRREALNAAHGGRLAPLYAATNVLAALEVLSLVVRRRVPQAEGRRILHDYMAVPSVRAAFGEFPLSLRRPILAAAVFLLRACFPCR